MSWIYLSAVLVYTIYSNINESFFLIAFHHFDPILFKIIVIAAPFFSFME